MATSLQSLILEAFIMLMFIFVPISSSRSHQPPFSLTYMNTIGSNFGDNQSDRDIEDSDGDRVRGDLDASDQGAAGWAGYSLPLITGAMSVKFEKETVRDTATVRPDGGFGPDGNVRSNSNFGPSGNIGQTGNIGPTGNIGSTGNTGPTGNIGQAGNFGQTGNFGPTGNVGSDGNIRAESTARSDGNIRSNVPLKPGKQTFAHELGERLTGGEGTVGYLALYLKQLQENPLRTKMLTSGSLAALQELLASWIAHDRSKNGHYFSSRIPKMAIYGAFISAPLGHVLITILQKMFRGTTSLKAKILQILVSNLIVSPIQNSIYLVSMAIIAGARTFHQVRATVRAGFMPVMKVSWITSPIALAFAQAFLPEQTWVPFFNIISFVIGTYINAHTKKKRLAALRKKHYGDGRSSSGRTDDYYRRD